MESVSPAGFYVTGGTLPPGTPSYVPRRADTELYEGLLRGEFCYVLTSRQMGKSSLMAHTAARLRQEGLAVVVLDLTAVGQNLSADQWYGGLLRHVGRQLDPSGDLEEELDDRWFAQEERVGPLERWMRALQEVVLGSGVRGEGSGASPADPFRTPDPSPLTPARLVIFLDEIDAVAASPSPPMSSSRPSGSATTAGPQTPHSAGSRSACSASPRPRI
jgi:AAA domain-containing protein